MPETAGAGWRRRIFWRENVDKIHLCEPFCILSVVLLLVNPQASARGFLSHLCNNSNICFECLIREYYVCFTYSYTFLLLLNKQVCLRIFTLAHFLSLDSHLPSFNATQIFYNNIGIDIFFLHKFRFFLLFCAILLSRTRIKKLSDNHWKFL